MNNINYEFQPPYKKQNNMMNNKFINSRNQIGNMNDNFMQNNTFENDNNNYNQLQLDQMEMK